MKVIAIVEFRYALNVCVGKIQHFFTAYANSQTEQNDTSQILWMRIEMKNLIKLKPHKILEYCTPTTTTASITYREGKREEKKK